MNDKSHPSPHQHTNTLTALWHRYLYYEMLKTIPLPALFVDDLGPLVTQYLPLSSATPAETIEWEILLKINWFSFVKFPYRTSLKIDRDIDAKLRCKNANTKFFSQTSRCILLFLRPEGNIYLGERQLLPWIFDQSKSCLAPAQLL